jgi:hypothetical protein
MTMRLSRRRASGEAQIASCLLGENIDKAGWRKESKVSQFLITIPL